ncbi:MAG: glucosylceramidase [Flavihumibacter sp. CACIAM 22H1]|nr:MAG: glucosylceramidase [Flavihumibacter sp. CACIAM 22H1]
MIQMAGAALLTLTGACSQNSPGATIDPPVTPPSKANEVDMWLTKADQSELLKKQNTVIYFADTTNVYPVIEVDSATSYQQVDGFGYTLTGASAYLLNSMGSAKNALLQELFGTGSTGIGISYLRVSIGASDLSAEVFSYNDLPEGETDPQLTKFSLSKDTVDLIPVIKEILAINPAIKIMGSPWSPPVWMKDNKKSIGGSLLPQYYSTYARYFVKYIEAMKAKGITIDAVTIQNEPQHGGNNPSLVMSAEQQADFVKNHLGPAFKTAGIQTKIVIWDHNCDNPAYPITILNDPEAKKFVDGSAFHLYAGDISALSTVQSAHPDKALYFTEQWTSSKGDFGGDLKWHVKNVMIGSMRNWSKIALEWNLANDATFGPHTPGGCTECKGALTITGASFTRNVSYYIVAHASKFIPAGSARIASNAVANLANVVFKRPDGKKVMLIVNESGSPAGFNIKYKGKLAFTSLPAGAVATYIW